MIRDDFLHQPPEFGRMTQFSQVAQFMHYYIIGQMFRQKNDLITEIQITLGRTTPPSAFLILDMDLLIFEIIIMIELF
jgi:hypothetical protein